MAEKETRIPQEQTNRQAIEKEVMPLFDFYDAVKGLAYHDSARFNFPSAVYSRNTFVNYKDNNTESITTAFVRINKPSVQEWLSLHDASYTMDDLTHITLLDQLPLFAIDRMGISIATAREDKTNRTDYTWTIAPSFRDKLMKRSPEHTEFQVEQFMLTKEEAEYDHELPQTQTDIANYLLDKQPGLTKTRLILPHKSIIEPSSDEITELCNTIDDQWRNEGSLFQHVSFFEFHAETLPEPPITEETI